MPNNRPPAAKRLRVIGGVVLAACFVLPAVRACDSSIVPAREMLHRPGVARPLDLLLLLAMFLAPYLFGALVALGAALAHRTRLYDRAIIALFGFQLAVFVYAVIDHALQRTLTWMDALALVIAAPGAALVIRAWSRPGGAISVRFIGALACTAWFGGFSLTPSALYGVYLATFGAALIVAAAIIEARAHSPARGFRLLWKLISARLE